MVEPLGTRPLIVIVDPTLVFVVETLLKIFVFGVGIGKLALNAPAKNLKASDTLVSDVQD